MSGTQRKPYGVLSLDDTLLTHYGEHFEGIAYLYDHSQQRYVWALFFGISWVTAEVSFVEIGQGSVIIGSVAFEEKRKANTQTTRSATQKRTGLSVLSRGGVKARIASVAGLYSVEQIALLSPCPGLVSLAASPSNASQAIP